MHQARGKIRVPCIIIALIVLFYELIIFS